MLRPMLAVAAAAAATFAIPPAGAQPGRDFQYDAAGLFFPDDHYRDGRYYPQRRIGHRDRVYRGRDGRYYCRRVDGTTGIIVGEDVDRLLGDAAELGQSRVIGEIPGAGPYGALSLRIDSGAVRCR